MANKVMVTVRVSEDTKSTLDKLCEDNGLKMRWVVEQAIIQYCEKHVHIGGTNPPKINLRQHTAECIEPEAK